MARWNKWGLLFFFILIVGDVLATKTIWQNHIKNASVDSNLLFLLNCFGHNYLNYLRASWNVTFSKLIVLLKSTVITRDLKTSLLAWDVYPKRQRDINNCLLQTHRNMKRHKRRFLPYSEQTSFDLHHWKIYLRIFLQNELFPNSPGAGVPKDFGTDEMRGHCPSDPSSDSAQHDWLLWDFFRATGTRILRACQGCTQQQIFTWVHQAGKLPFYFSGWREAKFK